MPAEPGYAVSSPAAAFERVADRIAERIMRTPEPAAGNRPAPIGSAGVDGIAHAGMRGRAATGTRLPGLGTGSRLPAVERTFFESRLGHELSNVRLHTGPAAAALAHSYRARAFTLGTDVVFGESAYQPGSFAGRRLLAHELVHTLQQEPGRPAGADKVIHRQEADPINLQSERFRGDLFLELVFDGQLALRSGNRGEPVRKVQQALIDAGFDLSRFGADAIYGSETRDAVRAFQREYGMVEEQIDGVVGAHTMERLDALFSPSPDPVQTCEGGPKTVRVDLVSLQGSSRNPLSDLAFANQVFAQCCVRFTLGTGATASPELSDRLLGGDTDLERAACGAVAPEELRTFQEASQEFGLTSPIRVFYVESATPSTRGSAVFPMCASGPKAAVEGMIDVTNRAAPRTLPHEFGHILLNVANAHLVNPDNIMHITTGAGPENLLSPLQCRTVFNRA